jgi:hypothetical protein
MPWNTMAGHKYRNITLNKNILMLILCFKLVTECIGTVLYHFCTVREEFVTTHTGSYWFSIQRKPTEDPKKTSHVL